MTWTAFNVTIFQPKRGIRISLANLGTASLTFGFIYGLPIDSKYQVCSFYPSTYVGFKAMYVIHVWQKEEVYRNISYTCLDTINISIMESFC
jgi:hypothetical protein